jgi:hypothetical protein
MDEVHRPGTFKHRFTPQEDVQLSEAVRRWEIGSWAAVAREIPGRSARQCRERWTNYLDPTLEQTPLSPTEELLLDRKFAELGPCWQVIVSFFPRRSRNFIKNQWMARIKKLNAAGRRRLQSDVEQNATPPSAEVSSEDRPSVDVVFREEEQENSIWEIDATWEF